MAGTHDPQTLAFYTREADAYTTRDARVSPWLDGFLNQLPRDASILELGCGAGQDSEVMLARGFKVQPTDGTPEIAAATAKRLGVAVPTLLFEELEAIERYHGLWANACLLHVPRAGLPNILLRIHRALRAGGIFYASFKAGTSEGHDEFGRFYNYPSKEFLSELYADLIWSSVRTDRAVGSGYDRRPTDWLHVTVVKA